MKPPPGRSSSSLSASSKIGARLIHPQKRWRDGGKVKSIGKKGKSPSQHVKLAAESRRHRAIGDVTIGSESTIDKLTLGLCIAGDCRRQLRQEHLWRGALLVEANARLDIVPETETNIGQGICQIEQGGCMGRDRPHTWNPPKERA